MKVLYVYAHPDDESFGPSQAMSYHSRHGHDVFLLTLTRGGATKQRHALGYSVEQMGEVRFREMHCVADVLGLSGMEVLDFPDGGLKEMDPRTIEVAVCREIARVRPHVLVTDAVHGISGFQDHLVTHAVVKRVFCEQKGKDLRRLAFQTISEREAAGATHFRLSGSRQEEIDCVMSVEDEDVQRSASALDCYETYRETIEATGIRKKDRSKALFEFFQEDFRPPLTDLFEQL